MVSIVSLMTSIVLLFYFLFPLINSMKLDGLLLEVNKDEFDGIMNKIEFALLLITNKYDASMLNNTTYKNLKDVMQNVAEQLIKETPAIGIFEVNCSYDNYMDICKNRHNKSLPSVLFYSRFKTESLNIQMNSDEFIIKTKLLVQSVNYRRNRLNTDSDLTILFENFLNSSYNVNKLIFYSPIISITQLFEEINLSIFTELFTAFFVDDYEVMNIIDMQIIENKITINPKYNINSSGVLILDNYNRLSSFIEYQHDNIHFIQDILLQATPLVIPYDPEDSIFKLIVTSEVNNHFVLIHDNNTPDIYIKNYIDISLQFRIRNEKVYFLIHEINTSDNDSDYPIIFFYDSFKDTKKNNLKLFNKNEVKFEFFHKFLLNKNNFHSIDSVAQYHTHIKSLVDLKENLIFSDYFIVYCFENESNSTVRKWNFMLERSNFLINSSNIRIPFYKSKFDTAETENMKVKLDHINFFEFPTSFGIYLYYKENEDYKVIQYKMGPSIKMFIDFLNSNSINTYDLTQEDVNEYFKHIFYNDDVEDDFGNIEDSKNIQFKEKEEL